MNNDGQEHHLPFSDFLQFLGKTCLGDKSLLRVYNVLYNWVHTALFTDQMCSFLMCLLYVSTVQNWEYSTTASSQPGNSRLQTRFWLVSAAWPARSCAVLRQVFVERRRYRHSLLRLAAPLPRLGLAEALEFLAMLCWVYNDYVLKFNILNRRLKQIMLTYMDTMKSKDGWVYNNMNYFRYSIYIASMIPADSRYDEKACRFCRKCPQALGRLELYTGQVCTQIRLD